MLEIGCYKDKNLLIVMVLPLSVCLRRFVCFVLDTLLTFSCYSFCCFILDAVLAVFESAHEIMVLITYETSEG